MAVRILAIEDNPPSLELMTYLLRACGYEVLSAVRGDDGLTLAQQHKPDLIICDIQLPGMDGYAIAKALRADDSTAHIPLIAVTALAMVGDREKVLAAGFNGYLSKPIEPETFAIAIQNFLSPLGRSPLPSAVCDVLPAKRSAATHGLVLVVDDTPLNIQLKRSILEPNGYDVASAGSAEEGLARAIELLPALIISDIGLPRRSGFELLNDLKSDPRTRDIPFILITSTHYEPTARTRALAQGAARLLLRPMDSQDLLAEIKACLKDHGRPVFG